MEGPKGERSDGAANFVMAARRGAEQRIQPRISRKQLIREWLAKRGAEPIAQDELKDLQRVLREWQPDKPVATLARLAEAVFAAGGAVRFGDFSGGEEDRVLTLDSLEALERGIARLHDLLTRAQNAGDRAGVERARMTARRARRRTLWIAENRRVAANKRAEKQEMSDWLLLWLEMPSAFFEWLPLRKRSEDFRRRFPHLTC